MKKLTALILSIFMLIPAVTVYAEDNDQKPSFLTDSSTGLYARGASADNGDAWQLWQNETDEYGMAIDKTVKYFFLPSGADNEKLTVYNACSSTALIGGKEIPSKSSAELSYTPGGSFEVTIGSESTTLKILRSTAEAAVYVNNPDVDGKGTALYDHLIASKTNSAKATGAIVGSDGSVDTTAIKKIKGRGNTTWFKAKKPFNITYSSAVSIAGMPKDKKFSRSANYQDASLARNRILFDLAAEAGVPYASDSRFTDFYINGVYYGSYQCCRKIEVGSDNLISDLPKDDHLTEGDTLSGDFSFVVEVDPSFGEDDYHTKAASNELTIKYPELESGDKFYDEVKSFVAAKFTQLSNTLSDRSADVNKLEETLDTESFAKVFLINELGKNWDSGVSSFYMTYKKSPDGKWRFYASPVWDYDNSLGNAVGVESDLKSIGVTDYTAYSGWWCRYKGKDKGRKSSNNIMNKCANNTAITTIAAKYWMEDFLPLINAFKTGEDSGRLLSAATLYNILSGTAEMNYGRGWLLNTGSWISDHSSLKKAYFDKAYYVDARATGYSADFKGEFDYAVDWLSSRAAWLTNEFSKVSFTDDIAGIGDVNLDGAVTIKDVTHIQRICAGFTYSAAAVSSADYNKDGKVNINDATAMQKALADAP